MKSLNIYKKRFKEFGVCHKSLLWQSKGAAHQRFRQFWAEIDFDNKSVLDIGCGFGEMGNFLTKRYKNVLYKGIDITDEFIVNGNKLYPELNLETADFFTLTKAERYDIVLASGVLNSNLKNNMEYRKKAIKKMFDLSDKCLAFNMLGTHPQLKNNDNSNVWYADSLEILKYSLTLTSRVIFRANYHPKDFTIFMFKNKKTVV
ncbi:MAG TPA: class I SAM-dependent methyltransferase [Patescibacteria group bacterium]|nr:class I SAM-dependent methyltransferase [Patescibacteria group bacterium]